MKQMMLLVLLLFPFALNAGIYLDLGIGWLRDVPMEAESEIYIENELQIRLEDKANVRIDSPFTRFTFGYRWEQSNTHIEYNIIGIINDKEKSIRSFQAYKRWEFDW